MVESDSVSISPEPGDGDPGTQPRPLSIDHHLERLVRGSASDLFALVMNRRDADGLDVVGDSDVLRVWRDSVRF